MGLKKLAEQVKEKTLLRVASPRECNMQQMTVAPATTDATPMQQHIVKASTGADSTCNTTRNSNALSLKKLCNKHSATDAQRVAPVRSYTMAAIVGPNIWSFRVDGKRITAIDYERRTYADMFADMQSKFGAERVTGLELRS